MSLLKRKKIAGKETDQEVSEETSQEIHETEQFSPFPFRDESLPWNENVRPIYASKGFEKLCVIRFVSADGKTIAVGEMPISYTLKDRILEAINDNSINEIRFSGKEYFLTYKYGFDLMLVNKETGRCEKSVYVAYLSTSVENRLEGNFNELEKTLEERLELPQELRQLANDYFESEEEDPQPPTDGEQGSHFDTFSAPEDNIYPEQPNKIKPKSVQAPNLEEILLSEERFNDKISGNTYDEATDSIVPILSEEPQSEAPLKKE